MKKPWRKRRQGRHRKSNQQGLLRDLKTTTYVSDAPPAYRSRFRPNGTPGTKPQAVILDMDGTLENWDGKPNPPGVEYVNHHHSQDRVIIVITARDHEWSYQRTHKWLKDHLAVPFVGPICRPSDDERYACDFKKDVYERLSHVYDIVGAIDDDNYVLGMWRSIPDLEVVETGYTYEPAGKTLSSALERSVFSDNYHPAGDSWRSYEDDWEEILREREIGALKRNQPDSRAWENDALIDTELCDLCQHPWFDHGHGGCESNRFCSCDG